MHILVKTEIQSLPQGNVRRPKIIFSLALQHLASNIILVHNHPSGNLKPSHSDVVLTKNAISAGQILDIKVMDHLIISDQGFFSMADEGVI